MDDIGHYCGIFNVDGKIAIVTGGSRGIGKALAEGLAAYGANIAIVVQSTVDQAEVVATGIRTAGRDAIVNSPFQFAAYNYKTRQTQETP